jgi:Xaa-Pro aminopeptidase
MQASLYNAVVKELPDVAFVNTTPVLNRARAVKNPEEIKAYEHVVSLVESGTNAAIRACKEGWGRYTEIEVSTLANHELLRRGCNTPDIWCLRRARRARAPLQHRAGRARGRDRGDRRRRWVQWL